MINLQKIYADEHSEVFLFNIEQNLSMLNESIVPKEQIKEIQKYQEEKDRVKRVLARTFLFEYCRKKYNLNDFSFEYKQNKRPKFQHSDIDFNISYSDNIIAIVLSKKYRVGVDIEYIKSSIVSEKVAFEFMSDAELLIFTQLDKKEQSRYFYEIWTSKEALLKAQGEGLYTNPKNVVNEQGKSFYFQEYVINFTVI